MWLLNVQLHLRSLDASFHTAYTADDLAKRTAPMYSIMHFLALRLTDLLGPARDTLLAMHPMRLTIEFLESRIEIETHLCTIASTTGAVVPPIFEGCPPPQFTTPVASAAVVEPTTTSEVGAVSTPLDGRFVEIVARRV
ncbi:unnamed protein product [Closterium sp. NIES-53]